MAVIVSTVWAFLFLACIAMLIRNSLVYSYRRGIISFVSNAARADIADGYDFRWRYDEYERVEYGQMMVKFWKRFDSFYPDKSFIDPSVKRGERRYVLPEA